MRWRKAWPWRLPAALGAAITLLPAPKVIAQDSSQPRVIRLSFVEGTVSVSRPDATDWATAPVNTPIQEGDHLSTDKNSYAEVQFEDGSTVRLGEQTQVDFDQLGVDDSGNRVSMMSLADGYATFHFVPRGGDAYTIAVAHTTLQPQGSPQSELVVRVDVDQEAMRAEVFKGTAEFDASDGQETVGADQVLQYEAGSGEGYAITNGITRDAWDNWVEQRDQAQAQQPAAAPVSPANYQADVGDSGGGGDSGQGAITYFGWGDLTNFGAWNYFPNIGYAWMPNVGYGWQPYNFGRWSYFPGRGYTWISSEPWGWLPYHYGQWTYQHGFGWAWIPGNLSNWSPAPVNWYQGQGWIGWSPQMPAGSYQPGCMQTGACMPAMSLHAFRSGTPVEPGTTMRVRISQGARVHEPNVSPTRLAMLTGSPVPPSKLADLHLGAPATPRNVRMGTRRVQRLPSMAEKAPAPGPQSTQPARRGAATTTSDNAQPATARPARASGSRSTALNDGGNAPPAPDTPQGSQPVTQITGPAYVPLQSDPHGWGTRSAPSADPRHASSPAPGIYTTGPGRQGARGATTRSGAAGAGHSSHGGGARGGNGGHAWHGSGPPHL
jgi:hypothetical protein